MVRLDDWRLPRRQKRTLERDERERAVLCSGQPKEIVLLSAVIDSPANMPDYLYFVYQ